MKSSKAILIRHILKKAKLPYTEHTINQILGTAAVESDFFKHDKQIGGGPARGYFQMEPATRRDIVKNYLRFNHDLRRGVKSYIRTINLTDYEFDHDFRAQVIFCYLHYNRYNAWGTDVYGYAAAWKRVYNTYKGKGTIEDFLIKYARYCR